jgi:gluconate:H+ symporter, GntP family
MVTDGQLSMAALLGIGVAVWLILRVKYPPFLGLLCGSICVGLLAGLQPDAIAIAVRTGFGEILSGVGILLALGLTLGAMLQASGGAQDLAAAIIRVTGVRYAVWGSVLAAMLVGLPLFFETGVVLLMPILGAVAQQVSLPSKRDRDSFALSVMLSALAGLSVLHAVLPPHPGPLLAISILHADLGKTVLFGALVAVPTAIISGPLLSGLLSRNISVDPPSLPLISTIPAPPRYAVLIVIFLPVTLIGAGSVCAATHLQGHAVGAWMAAIGNPTMALLVANLAGLLLLFRRGSEATDLRKTMWDEAMKPAGNLLLSVGMGGALKGVLVSAGVADMFGRLFAGATSSPILGAWLLSAAIRLVTGSATVATITAAGLMAPAAAHAEPEWIVLAVGAGSVFFSHVNDPGFWLVKSYLRTSTFDTFKTWSRLETVISVTGGIIVLLASRFL